MEDLALYKQGALVATVTMLTVAIGMKTTVSQNSEFLTVLLGAMLIMMVMIVKRIDEKTTTTNLILGTERRKTQELIHAGLSQMFSENNIMLTNMDGLRHAVNEDFKKLSNFVNDSNRFTYQKMDDISEGHNYRIAQVIDRLIRIEYKQERQEVRALDLEKRLKQKKRRRTPSMSSEAKRDILQKRQDRREAPGTPTESEVMSLLESPTPQELFPDPSGDGRIAPYEERDENDEEFEGGPIEKPTGMSKEQWDSMTTKEKTYFLLTVSWEAACVYEDQEQMSRIVGEMRTLADEINNERLASLSGASSSHHDVPRAEQSQNIAECEDMKQTS